MSLALLNSNFKEQGLYNFLSNIVLSFISMLSKMIKGGDSVENIDNVLLV